MSIKFTRSFRRQIYTQDVLMAWVLAVDGSKDDQITKEIREYVQSIRSILEGIDSLLFGSTRIDLVNLIDKKDVARYTRVVMQLNDVLNEAWAGNKIDLDFYNAILMVVEDTAKELQKSKNKDLSTIWELLADTVLDLYFLMANDVVEPKEFDSDWIGWKYMELGTKLGHKLERIVTQ